MEWDIPAVVNGVQVMTHVLHLLLLIFCGAP